MSICLWCVFITYLPCIVHDSLAPGHAVLVFLHDDCIGGLIMVSWPYLVMCRLRLGRQGTDVLQYSWHDVFDVVISLDYKQGTIVVRGVLPHQLHEMLCI